MLDVKPDVRVDLFGTDKTWSVRLRQGEVVIEMRIDNVVIRRVGVRELLGRIFTDRFQHAVSTVTRRIVFALKEGLLDQRVDQIEDIKRVA